jgi:hypothetical protein
MGEPEEAHAGHHKKRTGAWKLWMRYDAEDGMRDIMGGWSKYRSYESEEMANKAKALMERKWNMGRENPVWKFVVSLDKPKD